MIYFDITEGDVAGFSLYKGAAVDTIWFGPDSQQDNAIVESGGIWLMVV